jgi:hypothetical protein
MTRTWRSLGLALVVVATACPLPDDDRAAVHAWLQCDECVDGELARVTPLGNGAVPLLDTALLRAFPQEREQARRSARETYQAIGPLTVSESAYVANEVRNFDALFQTRAAIALREINTSRARDALQRAVDSAQARDYRPDVLAVIEEALATVRHRVFTGSFAPETVRFLDTIRASEGTGLNWDGDEQVTLSGSPFPDDLEFARTPDSLKFLAVAPPGTHSATITNLGTGADTQVAKLVVTHMAYAPHAPGAPVVVLAPPAIAAPPFPPAQPLYLALGSAVVDTTDHFRFEPVAVTPVTARLEWDGLSPLSLTWHLCPSPYGLATLGGNLVEGLVINEQGLPVAGAQVTVIATAIAASTNGSGEFSFGPFFTPTVSLMVRQIGYQPTRYSVQPGGGRHIVTLLHAKSTAATAANVRVTRATIPGGACWLLRVTGRSTAGIQIARILVTSP